MTLPGERVVSVRPVFQPIVDLRNGSLVAVEALSRGASGAEESAERLFAQAAEAGTVSLLDEACLRAALRRVREVDEAVTLFLNIEPVTLSELSHQRFRDLSDLVPDRVRVLLEVTERDLLERPAELVRGVRRIRDVGWGVALDDVGAEPAGLALMPFLQPDVIKLDLALVHERTTLQAAAVINAVRAEAERSGAAIVAEGIETEQHLERALAMGAQLGQGWLFGHPAPLDVTGMVAFPVPPRYSAEPAIQGRTPFEELRTATTARRAAPPLLAAMTRQLERQALLLDEQTVVLANFQHAQMMSAQTRRRYESLAAVTALTAVTGGGMPDEPAPGVHGTALDADDPLAREWVVIVISPHFTAALAARDAGADDGGPSGGRAPGQDDVGARRLDYILTYDRGRVLRAAGLLLEKVQAPTPRIPSRPGAPGAVPSRAGSSPAGPSRAGSSRAGSSRAGSSRGVAGGVAPDLPDLLLRAIATASNGIVIADARQPDLPLVYANAAFQRITGYALEDVLGRNCRFLQGRDTDRNQVQPIHRRLLAGRDVHTVLLNYRRDGTPFWNEVHISAVQDDIGDITHYIGNQLDVTTRVDRERRTTYLAFHDELTGLPNRAQVLEHLQLELRRAERSGMSVAAVLLDLDGFKGINDRFSHAAGDAALAWAAQRLRSALRAGDLLSRFGGDEFLVVLAGLPPMPEPRAAVEPASLDDPTAAERIVRQVQWHLHAALDAPFEYDGSVIDLSASSGAAISPRDGSDPADLVAAADVAMYRDKADRRS